MRRQFTGLKHRTEAADLRLWRMMVGEHSAPEEAGTRVSVDGSEERMLA